MNNQLKERIEEIQLRTMNANHNAGQIVVRVEDVIQLIHKRDEELLEEANVLLSEKAEGQWEEGYEAGVKDVIDLIKTR